LGKLDIKAAWVAVDARAPGALASTPSSKSPPMHPALVFVLSGKSPPPYPGIENLRAVL